MIAVIGKSTINCTNSVASESIKEDQCSTNVIEDDLWKSDVKSLAQNADTQIIKLNCDNQSILAMLNNNEYHNSYVFSPYGMYVGFGKEAIKNFEHFSSRLLIRIGLSLLGILLKSCKINKVVQVDNCLSSLNLHPRKITDSLENITKNLIKHFPQHVILLQNLNKTTDKELIKKLEYCGYRSVPTKLVHLYINDEEYMKRSHTKRDFSLLRNSSYNIVNHDELKHKDIERIHELYEKLFIEKHSEYNLKYTVNFFKRCWEKQWYTLTALRNPHGEIDAFISYKQLDNIMVCGPLGYDTSKPLKLGLYRMLFALNLKHAKKNKLIYNMGPANDIFKLNRGSIRVLDYYYVYCNHLSFYRRFPWMVLQWLYKYIVIKILQTNMF